MKSSTNFVFESGMLLIATLVAPEARLTAFQDGQPPLQQAEKQKATSPEAVTASELMPLRERTRTFKIVDGEGEGETLTMSLMPRSEEGEYWVLEFEGLYRLFMDKGEQGTVFVKRFDILEENQAVMYDPPVELVPQTAKAGQEISTSGTATIYSLQSGDVEHTGSYQHTIKRLSRADFHLPQQTVSGWFLDYAHSVDLDLADITLDLHFGCSQGVGIVYWQAKTSVEKVGLFGSTTMRTLEAIDLDEADVAAAER